MARDGVKPPRARNRTVARLSSARTAAGVSLLTGSFARKCATTAPAIGGPPPAEVVTAASWTEVEADLRGELESARRSPHDAFAVLNACRVLHSLRAGDAVQSKFGSAAWALRHLPAEHHTAVRAALAAYHGHAAEADARTPARGRTPLFSLVDSELARREAKRR